MQCTHIIVGITTVSTVILFMIINITVITGSIVITVLLLFLFLLLLLPELGRKGPLSFVEGLWDSLGFRKSWPRPSGSRRGRVERDLMGGVRGGEGRGGLGFRVRVLMGVAAGSGICIYGALE